jgi:rhamnosyltransferase
VNLARTEFQFVSPPNAGAHSDVCAVIVTYNPEPSFEQNVRALLPQVSKLIIVDNQSTSAGHSVIAQTAATCDVEVIWNQQNLGIAGGLNAGINRALAAGPYSWIATFDQDSRVAPDYVAAILKAYSACPFRDEVAIICANYSNLIQECEDNPIPRANGFVFREIKSAITSGSFVKSIVFGICGQYDESLFMDYVDHEFCLRLRKHRFRIIQAGNALLQHEIGSPTSHRFLWKRFVSTNHSSTRRYHNAHNRLLVYRRYLNSEISWVLNDGFGWLREIIKVALVERNRAEKLVSTAKGAWDAMKEPSSPSSSAK